MRKRQVPGKKKSKQEKRKTTRTAGSGTRGASNTHARTGARTHAFFAPSPAHGRSLSRAQLPRQAWTSPRPETPGRAARMPSPPRLCSPAAPLRGTPLPRTRPPRVRATCETCWAPGPPRRMQTTCTRPATAATWPPCSPSGPSAIASGARTMLRMPCGQRCAVCLSTAHRKRGHVQDGAPAAADAHAAAW